MKATNNICNNIIWGIAFAICLTFITAFPCQARRLSNFSEIDDIRQEISLLNLLRGLYLSKEQVQKLAIMSAKAQALRDELQSRINVDKTGVINTFSSLRDALYEPPGFEKQQQEKASALNNRFKEAKEKMEDEIAKIEDETMEILTNAQVSVINDFKPCLVPPKDFQNPVRVGQAGPEGGILGKVTELIHATPDDVWKERGEKLIKQISKKMEEESGEMTSSMKSDIEKRLWSCADSIRQCQDIDFALKKHQLSSELLLINPKKTSKHGFRKAGKIGQWLLSDTAAQVMPKWEKSMDKIGTPTAVECDDDLPTDGKFTELTARTIVHFRRIFKNLRAEAKLGQFSNFISPLEEAATKKDKKLFFNAVLTAADRLREIRSAPGLAKLYAQAARIIARELQLPLLNPGKDAYGFAAELKSYLEDPDPNRSCNNLRNLVGVLMRFKGL